VLHYTTLTKSPSFDEAAGVYFIRSSSLPHYVNPADWKLDFTDNSTQPLLNFILFVPDPAKEYPLHIQMPDGSYSNTNSFLSPQWGGVVIHNVAPRNVSLPALDSQDLRLSVVDLQRPMQIFLQQFRQLLGLESIDAVRTKLAGVTVVPATQNAISLWERDALVRRYLFYNFNSSVTTLKSLSKLVLSMPNMVVLDNILRLCDKSLFALQQAQIALTRWDYETALLHSQTAVNSAEEAFFDPNMVSMLYFPDEHKYAVYALPFAPITVQLVTGIWQELKSRRLKRKLQQQQQQQQQQPQKEKTE